MPKTIDELRKTPAHVVCAHGASQRSCDACECLALDKENCTLKAKVAELKTKSEKLQRALCDDAFDAKEWSTAYQIEKTKVEKLEGHVHALDEKYRPMQDFYEDHQHDELGAARVKELSAKVKEIEGDLRNERIWRRDDQNAAKSNRSELETEVKWLKSKGEDAVDAFQRELDENRGLRIRVAWFVYRVIESEGKTFASTCADPAYYASMEDPAEINQEWWKQAEVIVSQQLVPDQRSEGES